MIRETYIQFLLSVLSDRHEEVFELTRQGYALRQALIQTGLTEFFYLLDKDLEELEELANHLLSSEIKDMLDEALLLLSKGSLKRQFKE